MPLLLEDRSLEIPAFLLRNSDGTLMYPICAVPAVTATESWMSAGYVSAPPVERLTPADRIAIAQILSREEMRDTLRSRERLQRVKEQKALDKERMKGHKLKQREVFHKHFKWSVEI
jgi:hypothetical protein